jgi:hypothetical protein
MQRMKQRQIHEGKTDGRLEQNWFPIEKREPVTKKEKKRERKFRLPMASNPRGLIILFVVLHSLLFRLRPFIVIVI